MKHLSAGCSGWDGLGYCACALAWCIALASGCGGPPKQADSPGTCPEGTVLRGTDCVPPPAASDEPAGSAKPNDVATPPPAPSDTASAAPADKVPYDRDAVEAELKRGARQVKANCGAATDDNGDATGPWGATEAQITLGRNGHVHQVTVPAPYDGKPVGDCIVHSFDKIQFPPYAAESDAVVPWKVELVKPAKH